MRPNFSEFSYGYALTDALVNSRQHLIRPIFPTQRQESYLGYDVQLKGPGHPIFLQFKLCHGMLRGTARELNAPFRLPLALPFLRMPLMATRKSKQHVRLVDLEGRGEVVYYAAPRFFRDDDLAAAFRNGDVLSRSAFIRPSAIGRLPDTNDHCVVFEPDAMSGWRLSEPTPIDQILDGARFQEEVGVRLHDLDERSLSEGLRAALVNVTDTVIEGSGKLGTPVAIRDILRGLCFTIHRVYPDFPDSDAILDTPTSARKRVFSESPDLSEQSSMAFRRELQRMLDNTDATDRIMALLSTLAQLYFDSIVVLIAPLLSQTQE